MPKAKNTAEFILSQPREMPCGVHSVEDIMSESALAMIQQAARYSTLEFTCHAENRMGRRLTRPRPTKVCATCGQGLIRDQQHDAYYCPEHGWTEAPCGDPKCEFCVGRPERPATETTGKI